MPKYMYKQAHTAGTISGLRPNIRRSLNVVVILSILDLYNSYAFSWIEPINYLLPTNTSMAKRYCERMF